MPYPAIINNILAQILNDLPDNDQKLISAGVLRGVLTPLVQGIYDALANPDDVVLAQFPAYEGGTTYVGGATDVVVKHESKLYLFVSATDQTGVTPGTNQNVWVEFNLLALAHARNKDTHLDQGGPFQVSAQQIIEHITNDQIHQPAFKQFDENVRAAFVQDLINTPYTIVSAPGENKIMLAVRMWIMKGVDQGTEDYDQGVWFQWTNGVPFISPFGGISPNSETPRPIPFSVGIEELGMPEVNQGIQLILAGGNDFTQGDRDVRVLGHYWEKTL